jgi:hypothetical protein
VIGPMERCGRARTNTHAGGYDRVVIIDNSYRYKWKCSYRHLYNMYYTRILMISEVLTLAEAL